MKKANTLNTCHSRNCRKGAAAVTILVLLGLMFVALVFCVDVARIQLAELEHQCATDVATRAGAEAMSRGVGSVNDIATFESNIKDEILMIAALNSAGGSAVNIDRAEISFGEAVADTSTGAFSFSPSTGGSSPGAFEATSNTVNVASGLDDFPVVFGNFVGTENVSLGSNASAFVQDRDIVLVLDRTTSMCRRDAGSVSVAAYPANLRICEDLLYDSTDPIHDGPSGGAEFDKFTEFEIVGTNINLTRMQALKLAVHNFQKEIDLSRGHESLGIATYGRFANTPSQAVAASQVSDGVPFDIESPSFFSGDPTNPADLASASEAFKRIVGISTAIQTNDSPVTFGNGTTPDGKTETYFSDPASPPVHEKYASALELSTSGYPNFKHTFAAMRHSPATNIGAGIQAGADVLFGSGRRTSASPILIVMTDGNQNTGPDAASVATTLMADPSYRNMRIFTVSFGDPSDVDVPLMQSIANIGRGEHHHAANATQLVDVFRDLARNAGVVLIE